MTTASLRAEPVLAQKSLPDRWDAAVQAFRARKRAREILSRSDLPPYWSALLEPAQLAALDGWGGQPAHLHPYYVAHPHDVVAAMRAAARRSDPIDILGRLLPLLSGSPREVVELMGVPIGPPDELWGWSLRRRDRLLLWRGAMVKALAQRVWAMQVAALERAAVEGWGVEQLEQMAPYWHAEPQNALHLGVSIKILGMGDVEAVQCWNQGMTGSPEFLVGAPVGVLDFNEHGR